MAITLPIRAVAFFDGMNLFNHAKEAFGYTHPNYDPAKLTDIVCSLKGWNNHGVRFYTGLPDSIIDPKRHAYWTNRLLAMRRAGILAVSRPLHYTDTFIDLPDGSKEIRKIPREKGIDIRIALDIIRMVLTKECEALIIFSQDQDLAEVVKEAKDIARQNGCRIEIVSAYPAGGNATVKRGIDGADWVKIGKDDYDKCLDTRDYRRK